MFIIIFYLQNLQAEHYLLKKINSEEILKTDEIKTGQDKKFFNEAKKEMILRFIMPVLLSAGFIFLFIKFGGNYTAKFDLAKTITLINFSVIANEIYINYGILVFLVILLIFMLLIWIISIILIRKKK